ncbi:FAD-binding oxidoreductase [Novosphingobium sp.]|uniref:NAD(P)/FAD-dependent oxidoreductase n=1 Tax=Novosphingobium sp. TaxID=1874826 RepID=UPI00333E7FF9
MSGSRSRERAGPGGEDTSRFPRSYYADTVGTPIAAHALDGDAITDHCIIGGGFTGLGAALALARAGQSVRLIESGPIGWGASGRNGGQVHVGWQQDLPWLEAKLDAAMTRELWAAALDARAHLDALIAQAPDMCDYRPGLIHADHRPAAVAQTHAHVAMMRDAWGYDSLTALGRDELRGIVASDNYHGGSYDTRGGHLNPLKLAMTMARSAQGSGAHLHPHTHALAIDRAGDDWRVTTPHGVIRAGKVLDATGAYARALVPATDAHVLPINNYIATTAPLGPALAHSLIGNGAAVSDGRFVVYYFRMTPDHRLLFGGGENYGRHFPRDIAAFVRPHLVRIFPQLADVAIDHAWGGTLAVSPNRLPFVIEPAPGLYAANGFSGVGVVLAPWLGQAVGLAMAGKTNPGYDLVRRLPAPRFPGGPRLRLPTQALAMRFMALRDRF